jgi:hypothetical protein
MGANSIKTVAQDGQLTAASGIKTAVGEVLADNPRRLWWGIINLDDAPVLVKLGADASVADFHIPLKGGVVADDGNGGSFFDDTYTDVVSIAVSGGVPRVSVIEVNKEF